MKKRLLQIIFAALVLGLVVSGSSAQIGNYNLSWFTVDAGGGSSGTGDYGLIGTSGQADAGRMNGGEYVLTGGFWGEEVDMAGLYLPLIVR